MSTTPSEEKPATEAFFFLAKNEGGFFLEDASLENELLHPKQNALIDGDSLTETQYFSVNVPEENIHGLIYCWHHPNLKSITGGVWVWQGIKKHHLACEIFDIRSFMSDKALANNLHKFRLDNGYGVELLEPGKRFHATYQDKARNNSIDLVYTAKTPIVKFHDGMHFEQGMHVEGELVLRGKRYPVNSYNVRDRSWGALRPEDHLPLPPISWITCAFNENFFFNIIAADHPDLNPDWKGHFDLPADRVLKSGWIYRDGKLLEVVSCRKLTQHEPDQLFPTSITMELTDNTGTVYRIKGTITAASNWSAWLNSEVIIALCRWEYEGLTGYGDVQEARWTDYIRAMMIK